MSKYPTKLLEARYTEHFCLEMLGLWETACGSLPDELFYALEQKRYWTDHLKAAVAWRQNGEALDD